MFVNQYFASMAVVLLMLLLAGAQLVSAGVDDSMEVAEALDRRYVPRVNWRAAMELERFQKDGGGRYWRTAAEIKAERAGDALPLSGVKVALDPGHLGGAWGPAEGRHFRINADDFMIQEGDLVLEVAFLVRDRLRRLGAAVELLRDNSEPVNSRHPLEYLEAIQKAVDAPVDLSVSDWLAYFVTVRDRAIRQAIVIDELLARATLVNEGIQPDVLVSLHINATAWPVTSDGRLQLVERDHSHVLIFGAVLPAEFERPGHRRALIRKVSNGSGAEEVRLGESLGSRLGAAMGLPPSSYDGQNAIRPVPGQPYLWARNLLLLREVDCPAVLLEPFLANSVSGYAALQSALEVRAKGEQLKADDILVAYADAVVAGLMDVYGGPQ